MVTKVHKVYKVKQDPKLALKVLPVKMVLKVSKDFKDQLVLCKALKVFKVMMDQPVLAYRVFKV